MMLNMSTLAYEIGGTLLLAALVMYGTLVSGFIPETLRTAKAFGIALVLLLSGLVAYQWFPEVTFALPSISVPAAFTADPAPPTPAPQTDPTPLPPVPHRIPTRAHPVAQPTVQERPRILGLDQADSAPVEPRVADNRHADPPGPAADTTLQVAPVTRDSPAVQVVPSVQNPPSPAENPAKRVVKSIGSFLHIGRKKKTPSAE